MIDHTNDHGARMERAVKLLRDILAEATENAEQVLGSGRKRGIPDTLSLLRVRTAAEAVVREWNEVDP